MPEDLDALSRSGDYEQRIRAAEMAGVGTGAANDEIVVRLLNDRDDTAVTDAMANALLRARREGAVPLILQVLGECDDPEVDQHVSEALLNARGSGAVDVDAVIFDVLGSPHTNEQVIAALEFLEWAISPYEPIDPRMTSLAARLTEDDDGRIASAARGALAKLSEPRKPLPGGAES